MPGISPRCSRSRSAWRTSTGPSGSPTSHGKLDTSGAPDAPTPQAGDLAHYAPWRNLALFYRDGERSPGLVILGRLDDSQTIDRLATADRVTIEPLT
ncbi:cyclophilin-like fold protein [Streptomyces yanii]|uniref:cyclophilin-like fold protein n=1 Tax=Streptomyces yanii TaxID=78510 RepID=UPI0031F03A97